MPSTKSATNEFAKYLSTNEIKTLKSRLFFIDFSHKFHSKSYRQIDLKNIYFCVINGLFKIKIKSIIIFFFLKIKLMHIEK